MSGSYNLVKTICIYPQGYCCGNTSCRLYDKCSVLPKGKQIDKRKFLLTRIEPLTTEEYKLHIKKYKYYNYIFGDYKMKQNAYRKANWERYLFLQRERRHKLHPPKIFTSVLYKNICNLDCEKCPYEDCRLPVWENKKEYDALYYLANRDKRLETSQKYYLSHKEECLKQQKEYRNKNRKQIHKKQKLYRELHKDEINARKRERYRINKEREYV